MQNTIKYFIFLNFPVILQDLSCMVQREEFTTKIIPLVHFDIVNVLYSLLPDLTVSHCVQLRVSLSRLVKKLSALLWQDFQFDEVRQLDLLLLLFESGLLRFKMFLEQIVLSEIL